MDINMVTQSKSYETSSLSHVYAQPFVDTTLNTLETMALTVSFLTLYLGLMFYQGWLKEDWQKTGLSMLIVISNVIFMFCAAKMIFKEFIEDKIGINKAKYSSTKNEWTKITPSEDDGNARRGHSNSADAALANSRDTKQQTRKERSNSVDIIAERAWRNSGDDDTEEGSKAHHYNL